MGRPFRSRLNLLHWLALWGAASAAVACAQTTSPKPIHWGSHGLAIPYRLAGNRAALSASEVVLYVSRDRGASWQQVARAAPQVHSFQYQAERDGEYWFALRTYDRYGGHQPAGPLQAEMVVLVDTTSPRPPVIEAQIVGGQLKAKVLMDRDESHSLDPGSLRLYAQIDSEPNWRPLSMLPSGTSREASGEIGLPAGARSIALRASVADLAGNRAESAKTISASEAGMASGPWLNPRHSPALTPGDRPVDPFVAHRTPTPSTAPSSPSQPWPIESNRTQTFAHQAPPPSSTSPFRSASFGPSPLARPDPLEQPAKSSVSRSVGSTSFEFDYDLQQSGRWGVAQVELWGTTDGGRSWRRFAIDSDRQSPIHVTVPSEGEYGFRILVEPVGGVEPPAPRPGEKPEVTVRVDLVNPRVTIGRVEQGEGYLADRLNIAWSVVEDYPTEQAIDLFYSNRASGPWVPVAMGIHDSGRYAWRLQRHLPEQIYLRVEARDAAGNVGSSVTAKPISIDLPRAAGTLRGVRAVNSSP